MGRRERRPELLGVRRWRERRLVGRRRERNLQDAEAATDDYGGSDLTWTDTHVVINTDPASANGQGFDPSMFYAWTPDPAEEIPTLVPAGAGAGVLTGDEH